MTGSEPIQEIYSRIRQSWNADAPSYDRRPGHGSLTPREEWAWRRAITAAFAPIRQDSARIADIGAGTGTMSLILLNMGHKVTAVDLAPAMLEHASQKAKLLGIPLPTIEANAASLPFEDDSFDIVFSRHVFWTLPEPVETLREWVRVVRPGGMVAIADGWWNEPGGTMSTRRAIGRAVRRISGHPKDDHAGYGELLEHLPVSDGVSPYSIRYFLDQANLTKLRVRDLKSIRAAGRDSRRPWNWIDQARFTWLATGIKPVSGQEWAATV